MAFLTVKSICKHAHEVKSKRYKSALHPGSKTHTLSAVWQQRLKTIGPEGNERGRDYAAIERGRFAFSLREFWVCGEGKLCNGAVIVRRPCGAHLMLTL